MPSHALPWKKILIPVDFSEVARRSAVYALSLASDCDARVVLLTVIDEAFPYPELFEFFAPGTEGGAFFRAMRERALQHMGSILEAAPPGVDSERLVVRGKPRDEIIAMAEEVGADLVVMARRDSGKLRSALLGSTTEAVIRLAPCPVLVLPPTEGERRGGPATG